MQTLDPRPWLALGGGPSAAAGLRACRALAPRVITTNAGLEIVPAPDMYFLSDQVACRLYRELARAAQRRGAHLVTLARLPSAIAARGVGFFDEFLPEAPPYRPFRLSGVRCVQYAAEQGAATIYLAGHDGYATGPSAAKTVAVIAPEMQALAAQYPQTAFVCLGAPLYSVESPNWRVQALA